MPSSTSAVALLVIARRLKPCFSCHANCVTFAKLADFMDQQNAETLAAYRKGDFARMALPALKVAQVSR